MCLYCTSITDIKLILESAKNLNTKHMSYDHLMNNNVGWSSAEIWTVKTNDYLNFFIKKFVHKLNPPKLRFVCIFTIMLIIIHNNLLQLLHL